VADVDSTYEIDLIAERWQCGNWHFPVELNPAGIVGVPCRFADTILAVKRNGFTAFVSMWFILAALTAPAVSPPYFEVRYAASTNVGELRLGVTYTLWMPPGAKTLRGIIVHQHGCGEPACKGGATAAYDLHWQALARKWDCALLGPSYHQAEKDNCAWWCDPRQGSEKAFLRALADFAAAAGRPELARAPWALWGHSGGANWVGNMLLLHPERVAAVWLRSGSPRLISARTNETDNAAREFPAASLTVPVMCNLGRKEKEGRFARLWDGTLVFFKDFRAKGALVGFAPDPRTSHECGDSRYLAIPWFDACLAQRLPKKAGAPLRAMPAKDARLAPLFGEAAQSSHTFTNDIGQSVWLPNQAVAKAWSEYVKTGATTDNTPPPAARNVRISATGELTWAAEADFESGLAGFIIIRDGIEIARLPEKPAGPFGRPLFQKMSYHDTPELPLPEMRYTDTATKPGVKHRYEVIALNTAGLKSQAAKAR
jgi:pimeloyl-ACP methyl ester carboxylesterase